VMPNEHRNRARDLLIFPTSFSIIGLWLASGVVALYTGDVRVFAGCTMLMGGVCGFVFGVRFSRNAGELLKVS
jgi:uncharacterized membrane protein required for colicin V production